MSARSSSLLTITADDFGYSPSYDAGILDAARAGAIDSVSALVGGGGGAAGSLLETGVEVGLHLDVPARRDEALREAGRQLRRFTELFGRSPAYLDGHHHCHAAPGVAAAIGQLAREHELPVRSVDEGHRRLLRALGVPTQDHLIGRLDQSEPAIPREIQALLDGAVLPNGVAEWMVHPGLADPAAGSRYDTGRGEDLRLLLDLGDREAWRRRGVERTTHVEALLGTG